MECSRRRRPKSAPDRLARAPDPIRQLFAPLHPVQVVEETDTDEYEEAAEHSHQTAEEFEQDREVRFEQEIEHEAVRHPPGLRWRIPPSEPAAFTRVPPTKFGERRALLPRPVAAGILLFNEGVKGGLRVYLVLSGSPWISNSWGIPKGKVEDGETYLEAAKREFQEEMGIPVPGPIEFEFERVMTTRKHKDLFSFGCRADLPMGFKPSSNECETMYRGVQVTYSEVVDGGWFSIETAKHKIAPSQRDILAQLEVKLGVGAAFVSVPATIDPEKPRVLCRRWKTVCRNDECGFAHSESELNDYPEVCRFANCCRYGRGCPRRHPDETRSDYIARFSGGTGDWNRNAMTEKCFRVDVDIDGNWTSTCALQGCTYAHRPQDLQPKHCQYCSDKFDPKCKCIHAGEGRSQFLARMNLLWVKRPWPHAPAATSVRQPDEDGWQTVRR